MVDAPFRIIRCAHDHPHAMTARPTTHYPDLRTQAHAGHRPVTILSENRAFTLIEMIVVTALISIMLVVAIPRLDGGLFTDGSDETARWIVTNVRQLKEKSIVDQKTYILNVSPDIRRLWITEAGMTDEDSGAAREEGFRLPRGMTIDQVAFSQTERLTGGTIPIGFYPKGYSDKAVIRMRTNDGDRLAFFIEPFLPGARLVRGSQGW
jgi:prepilin-type N-terminal cleavage/methylation domain-containing protein